MQPHRPGRRGTRSVRLYQQAWVAASASARGGMGPVAHRGGRLRHPRRGHPHRRSRRRRPRRHAAGCSPTAPPATSVPALARVLTDDALRERLARRRGRAGQRACRGSRPRSASCARSPPRRPTTDAVDASAVRRGRTARSAFAAPLLRPAARSPRPGQVVADTKSYLYLDPDRLLSRAWSMWDPHVGMGTVTHQNIGFLWPMGPYYWADGAPGRRPTGWRSGSGSARSCSPPGSACGTCCARSGGAGRASAWPCVAYALTPYLLTIAVRISAILLPFAALPWMVALTDPRSAHRRLAPPGRLRARRGHGRHEQRDRDPARRGRARCCGCCGRRRPVRRRSAASRRRWAASAC